MFIDTHCHLDRKYYENLNQIIDEMDNNIMIASGSDPISNKEVIKLVEKYPNIYGTLGLHPEVADNYLDEDLEFIEDNISNSKIVAIGEIGLDYYYGKENIEKQKKLFQKQIELAIKFNKTIVIHSRDAFLDTYNMLKENNLENHKIVMHCYSYSLESAKMLEKMNIMFGIGGVLTFKNGQKLKEVVENIDITKLLLETDSPYLAPEPLRGKVNNPKNSYIVASKIAEIKNITIENVLDITTKNAIAQFDLKL